MAAAGACATTIVAADFFLEVQMPKQHDGTDNQSIQTKTYDRTTCANAKTTNQNQETYSMEG